MALPRPGGVLDHARIPAARVRHRRAGGGADGGGGQGSHTRSQCGLSIFSRLAHWVCPLGTVSTPILHSSPGSGSLGANQRTGSPAHTPSSRSQAAATPGATIARGDGGAADWVPHSVRATVFQLVASHGLSSVHAVQRNLGTQHVKTLPPRTQARGWRARESGEADRTFPQNYTTPLCRGCDASSFFLSRKSALCWWSQGS